MKKTLFIAGAITLIFAVSSCKKNYTCECNTVTLGFVTSSTSTTIHDTKNNAEDQCEEGSITTTVGGITTTKTCTLK